MARMENTQNLTEARLANAWAELQAHADQGNLLEADAYRLAFADPEFLLRRETRGIRIQLEMLKPDLDQAAQGIENTVVVFGSARFPAPEDGQRRARQRPRPVATPPPWRWPSAMCATPCTTTRPACLPAWWPATAPASRSKTACSSAPAAAPASWKPPTAAPLKWARPPWA